MKKWIILSFITVMLIGSASVMLYAESESKPRGENEISQEESGLAKFGKYIGAGLAITGATIGSGLAVGRIGSAAIGSISEKPETTGISLVFVALAEGISLWGFLVAFFILQQK